MLSIYLSIYLSNYISTWLFWQVMYTNPENHTDNMKFHFPNELKENYFFENVFGNKIKQFLDIGNQILIVFSIKKNLKLEQISNR